LLTVGDEVTVVERDRELAQFLREEFAAEIDAGELTVIEGDALEVDLPEFTASVSNLPTASRARLPSDCFRRRSRWS